MRAIRFHMSSATEPIEALRAAAPSHRGCSGYSLTELLVATAMSTAVAAGSMMSYVGQRTALKHHEQMNERNQNVGAALRTLTRDLRMSGYGLRFSAAELPEWIHWATDSTGNPVSMTQNPMILEGVEDFPDALLICGALDVPLAEIAETVAPGATSIRVAFGQGSRFNTTNRRVIYVGRAETARITEVQGDFLLVSTDPTLQSALQHAYPEGSPIELVQTIRYECDRTTNVYPYEPRLLRNDCANSNLYSTWQHMVGKQIDNAQFEMDDDLLTVTLTGRTQVRMPNASTHSTEHRERLLTATASVLVRNRLE